MCLYAVKPKADPNIDPQHAARPCHTSVGYRLHNALRQRKVNFCFSGTFMKKRMRGGEHFFIVSDFFLVSQYIAV